MASQLFKSKLPLYKCLFCLAFTIRTNKQVKAIYSTERDSKPIQIPITTVLLLNQTESLHLFSVSKNKMAALHHYLQMLVYNVSSNLLPSCPQQLDRISLCG